MIDHSINLLEYLHKLALEPDADFLRESLKVVTQLLMEAEVAQAVGAQKYERSEERTNHRNGYRERVWETRVGRIDLRIPKLRKGSYFPDWLLEPRRLRNIFSVNSSGDLQARTSGWPWKSGHRCAFAHLCPLGYFSTAATTATTAALLPRSQSSGTCG